jgi:hypothetical protein
VSEPLTEAAARDLLAKAEAATPAPWRVEQGVTHLEIRAPHQTERAVARVYCDLDAAYMAAASPGAVAALARDWLRLREELAAARGRYVPQDATLSIDTDPDTEGTP